MKKVFVVILLIVMMASMSISTVFAASDKLNETVGEAEVYVHDLADLLSKSEEEALIDLADDLGSHLKYNILFLTTDDANNKSTMVWSDNYMDELFPIDEDNIAFVIDMDNREIYINTMGKSILCLTDSMIDIALDNAFDYVVDAEYYECMYSMASYCLPRLMNDPPAEGVYDEDGDGNADSFGDAFVDGMVQGILPGGLVTVVVIVVLLLKHNKANKVISAQQYLGQDGYKVEDKDEIYLRTYTNVHKGYYKPKSSSSSGGSRGGGSSHSSSSGRSHGGGGRRF